MPETPLLKVDSLSCIRDHRVLFEDINMSLCGGQMLLVEGANGSGKTSLLRILTGLKMADKGEIYWRGTAISAEDSDYHQSIAYVGHQDGIKRELTCLENLRLVQAMGNPAEVSLDDTLGQLSLYRYGDTPVSHLSAGQRRRLALARLMVTKADLWILDEPYTSLDKASIGLFESLFESHLKNKGIIIMTSHNEFKMLGIDLIRLNLSA